MHQYTTGEQFIQQALADNYTNFFVNHFLIIKREHLCSEYKELSIEEIDLTKFNSGLKIIHNGISDISFVQLIQKLDFIIFVDGKKSKMLKNRLGKNNIIIDTPLFL